ncbi:hypothetical protein ABTY20_18215 [Streptomyces sp. NPDC126497]|uniref:hypothetical protein n=1 Tax=Streptomyces sp. NPDC126497 TaxID=3155313 RepID=UPI00332E29B6
MPVPLTGVLLLVALGTAAAGAVTVVLVLNDPPLSSSRLCAALALVFGSSAVAVYCHGWFSVTLGGPFPALCEDRNAAGAALARMVQEHWPLRSACVYSDGATVEHVSAWVNVLVLLPAGLAVVLACAGAVLRRRPPAAPEGALDGS